MASSSSSHKQNRESNAFSEMEPASKIAKVFESSRLFDAFINHRGPDVKETLAMELYNSLSQLGIKAFLDSQEKELGKLFTSTIETAIRSAQVHIAIFSPRYAESPWCLAELLLMIESKVKIIPVFYEVEPWELRHIEKGRYGGAFIEYEKKGRYLQKLNEWKEALQTLSFIAGVEFHSFSDYKTIIAAAEKEVLQSRRCLHVAKYPVGLNNLVEDFERRCLDELVQDFENQCGLAEKKNRPNVVGIFGMGGVGKTTLAKELFNRKHSEYSRASFLFDVRETSARGELHRLQSKLVKDLFHREETFTSIEEGKSYLNILLTTTIPLNFLIVVDDIDHVEQLEALLIMDTLNKSGNSLIIVTTRDVGVMISTGITIGYPLKGMDRNNGRQLFCWHAFDHSIPSAGYEALVEQFVDVCGGLPLSLLVLGRLVHGRDLKFWESNLVKAKKTLPRDVKQRLKISFDALEDEEKQVFMDFACFFLWKSKYIAERIFDGSGWGAQTALQTLKDKCLIEGEEFGDGYRMHDHLRDLGREMALELSPPHRLWRPQDLQSMELIGLQNILAKTNIRCFHSFVDNSMGYRVRFFLGQSDSFFESSASLLWLELKRNEYMTQRPSLPSLPAWIPLQHLQVLKIYGGSFKTLWENHTQPLKLSKSTPKRFLSKQMKTISPHQHQLSKSSRDLQKVSVSGDPIQLRELIISDCHDLEELPSLSRLSCMKNIEIKSCDKLKTITLPTTVTSLSITRCRDLQRVSRNGDLVRLGELIISGCPELEELPSLSRLSCMEKIEIKDCEKLKTITLPTALISLYIASCRDLQRVSGNGDLVKLGELIIWGCPELEELPSLSRLICMEKIEIKSCEKLKTITLPTTLTSLSITSCTDLQRVSGNGDLIKPIELIISDCPKLEKLPSLSRTALSNRSIIDGSNLASLKNLDLKHCRQLRTFPDSLQKRMGLEKLIAGNMRSLELGNLVWSTLPAHIKERPQVSYDALAEQEREMFLDTACFLIGEKKSRALTVWDGSGWNGIRGLETIENKCLVELVDDPDYDGENIIRMQDHIRDMGREIAGRHSPCRVWSPDQIINMKKHSMEIELIRGILPAGAFVAFKGFMYQSMGESSTGSPNLTFPTGLQILSVEGKEFTEELASLSEDLVWLRWEGFPFEYLPSWLQFRNLRILELYGANELEGLWEDKEHAALELRELIIAGTWSASFERFPSSISYLKYLRKISLLGDVGKEFGIKGLPEEFCDLQSLELLELRHCTLLSSLPTRFGDLSNLRHLDLCSCEGLRILPDSFKRLAKLQYLDLSGCKKLALQIEILENIAELKSLNLSGCHKLRLLPHQITTQACLRKLRLEDTRLEDLPTNIGQLRKLESLTIGSPFLTRLPVSLGDLSSLKSLSIIDCIDLESLPNTLGNLTLLENLCIESSAVTSLPEGFTELVNLQRLKISGCPLSELDFGSESSPALCNLRVVEISETCVARISITEDCCPRLKTLHISRNDYLEKIETLPTTVELKLSECENFQSG